MSALHIRAATKIDLPRLTEIYNHYVIHTPVTFDIEPYTIERRAAWFEQFGSEGRHRLLVAEGGWGIVGYAGTTRFPPPRLLMTQRLKLRSIARRTQFTNGP